MRYISTKLIIEKKLLEFRYQWQNCRAEIKGTEIEPDKQKLIIADFQKFVSDIVDEVIKETGSSQLDLEEELIAYFCQNISFDSGIMTLYRAIS